MIYHTPILCAVSHDETMAEIEEMAERGPTCSKLVSEELGISPDQATRFLGKLVKSGALVKCKNTMRIGGEPRTMYELAANVPKQAKLIDDFVPQRDWLVAAFFGETACR